MQSPSARFFVASLLGAVLLLPGCDAPPSPSVPSVERSRTAQPDNQQDLKQRQIAFLNRIREADPQGRTIERALLNEQNELGLVLDRTVEMHAGEMSCFFDQPNCERIQDYARNC
jgi:hypothetical protein